MGRGIVRPRSPIPNRRRRDRTHPDSFLPLAFFRYNTPSTASPVSVFSGHAAWMARPGPRCTPSVGLPRLSFRTYTLRFAPEPKHGREYDFLACPRAHTLG